MRRWPPCELDWINSIRSIWATRAIYSEFTLARPLTWCLFHFAAKLECRTIIIVEPLIGGPTHDLSYDTVITPLSFISFSMYKSFHRPFYHVTHSPLSHQASYSTKMSRSIIALFAVFLFGTLAVSANPSALKRQELTECIVECTEASLSAGGCSSMYVSRYHFSQSFLTHTLNSIARTLIAFVRPPTSKPQLRRVLRPTAPTPISSMPRFSSTSNVDVRIVSLSIPVSSSNLHINSRQRVNCTVWLHGSNSRPILRDCKCIVRIFPVIFPSTYVIVIVMLMILNLLDNKLTHRHRFVFFHFSNENMFLMFRTLKA